MIRVGIAEDQALVRESLAIVLNLQADIQILWTAENGAEAVQHSQTDAPDTILMDLRMPGMDGISALKAILAKHPQVNVIVLTTFHHDEWLLDALNAGAIACFLKEIPPQRLLNAIRLIGNGEWPPENWAVDWRKYAPEIQFQMRGKAGIADDGAGDWLTSRELDILRALCDGRTNAEIAATRFLTEGTVKNYVSAIYHKLGVRHRAEAVRVARERGLA